MKSVLNRSNICQLLNDSNELSQEKIALEFDNHSLTYSEFQMITNQRADLICKKYKVNSGDVVGIYLDCKFNAILWIIAILKAGGTYVVLDNKWPELRINQVVKLANLELLITYGTHINHLKKTFKLLNCIDYQEIHTSYDESFSISDIEKSTLAYIVFTSGSTGIPKGVTMSHGALLHYLDWEWSQHIEQFHTDIRVLQFFPLSFDISFQEFFTTLVLDGTVIIAPDSIKNDMHEFVKFIDKMSINKLYIPYVFLVELAEYCYENNKYPQSLHQIISSGEKLLLTQKIKNLFIHMPNCKLINLYGASEIQVVSVYEMQGFPGLWSDIGFIGKPIKHVSIYLLDENKQIVNGNAIGEIYIESECLTSGYLTDDLSANKKFVVLEIDGHAKKLYSTGDLARYVDDGNIEYIGRRDFQVKIRGHRVELGEVDRALLAHSLVQQAVTLAVDDAKSLTKLISYIVLDGHFSSIKKNPDVILDLTEKIEFKIAQHNIRKFPEFNTIKLDEIILSDDVKDVYFRRKSYRNYQNIEIDDANFNGLFRHLSDGSFEFNKNEHQPSFFSRLLLNELLALLASIQLDRQILPKYRYPSAGSLYPVQIYLEIGAGITDIPPGHYYYNPEQHALQMTDNKPTTGGAKLYFVGNLSSIEPLYGNLSEKFCLIELGYMLGLIKSDIQSQGFTLSSLANCNQSVLNENFRLHSKDIFLGGYELIATHQEEVQRVQPEVFIYIKGKVSQYNLGWYKYDIERKVLTYINNTESFELSIVSDKNYPIFNQATFVIFFISKNSEKNSLELLFTETGMLAQSLMQHAPNYHIGLCPIGMIDSNNNKILEKITNGFFIHAMFGGSIEPSQIKDYGQSQARSIESIMTEVLKHYLLNKIPDYMQPAQMVFLDSMPLNVNGKIDRKALPQSELVKEHIYAAARNDVERELIKIWSDVLQCDEDKLGIRDDFFWLGGNSIASIQLTSKLRQKFSVTLSFKDIFTYKTIESLYDNVILPHSLIHDAPDTLHMEDYPITISDSYVIKQDYLDRIQADGAVEAVYLANSLQQGFIYHAITQGEIDDAYIVQRVWEYATSLDLEKLKSSWLLAIQKYQSLRLRFAWQEELVQVIDKLGGLDWRYIEVTGKFDDIEQQKLRIQHIITQDRLERYNLEQGKLFRVYIIKQHDSLYTCIFSHHHAILDGWSNSIVFNFIHNTYLQLLDKKTVSVICDYAYKQTQQYLQAHRQVYSDYWNKYISQVEEKANLQGLIFEKNIKLVNYKHIKNSQEENLNIDGDLFRQLKLFSQTEGVTVNSILQYIWHKILHVYGNSKHTVVGTVISGRSLPIAGIEDSVGLYINTLPLIVDHDKQDKKMIIKAIKAIQDNIGEMNERSGTELSTLQKDGRRLFDVLFICDNYPEPKIDDDRTGRLKVNLTAAIEKLDYPLVFIVYELDDKLVCTIKYAGELFRDSVIKQLLNLVSGLLAQVTIKSQKMLTRDLNYLTTIDEAYQTIFQWNATDVYYPQFKPFLQFFEERVKKYADKIAVVYGDTKITYRELDAQSSQLACRLQLAGIQRNDLVGIYLERSHLTIIGIIGIIKSGGAYTPIDTLYPNNRVNYILQDAQLKFILTSVALAKNLSMDLTVIFLEGSETTCKDMRESFIQRCSLDTIYSLYTSGSTGLPKASSIHHSGFINLLHWYINSYKISETDKVLIISSICFDLTQKNILGLLLSGGEVHILHSKHYDAAKIITVINEQSITILNCTPSAFYGLLDESLPMIKLKTLKKVFLGGEPINTLGFKGIRENSLNFQIINTYGPTECSDITSAYDLTETDINNNSIIPIGKPIHNVQVYILNRHMELLPPGAVGELYIGGVSVSLGYLNKPGLTAEKFIPNLFQSEQERLENRNFRLYKTGDLARWMPDGNIEFLGRIDFQIKIRGFRIELGEIESTIQSIVGVKESVVLMREDVEHQKRLVLYIVLENKAIKSVIETAKQEIDRKKKMVTLCREICQSSLPDYMQPSQIIVLDNFPLTPNGKIDRKAFPIPENIAEKKLETNELPVGLFETQLADVWKDIFKVDPIGRNDNFFYLGGDSIISIQMVARARQKGILLTVNQVFKTPTVAGLIAEFQSSKRLFNEEKSMLTGTTALLLPIQRWFFEKADNIHHFNQAHWFVVKKAEIEEECRIDVTRLKNAIEELCEYHDAFRLKYKQKDGYWEQYYSDHTGISFEVIKESSWTEETLENICSEIQSGLDIERGPLSRVVWFEGKGLFWVIHHLIVDGVSWRILIEDLNTLYEGHSLGLKGHSYKTWGSYLQGYNHLESTKAYYSNKPKTGLCLEATSQRTRHKINFSAETSKSFIQTAHKAYNTQANDLLLTALVQAMGAYSNYQLCIDMEGHGREMLGSDLDLTRTVGWFTTVFPVYLTLSEPMNLDTSIKEIKEQLRQVPEKGITYGLASYIQKQIPKILSANISFNYLGQWDTTDASGHTFKWGNEGVGHCLKDNNRLFHDLDILGQIKDGVLSFEWESNYEASLIREWANNFKERLEALILHCSTEGVCGYTPSDFVITDISQEELESLLNS